jgi:transcriptional regulator with XRE-family HTH domain
MTQTDWPGRIAATVASQVRRYRRERKVSGQKLCEKMSELGLDFPRSVLANLETGRRETVTVAELIVLAKALEVAPLELLIPAGGVEMLPGVTWSPQDAAQWFSRLRCPACKDEPPAGFTCNTCGRSGS